MCLFAGAHTCIAVLVKYIVRVKVNEWLIAKNIRCSFAQYCKMLFFLLFLHVNVYDCKARQLFFQLQVSVDLLLETKIIHSRMTALIRYDTCIDATIILFCMDTQMKELIIFGVRVCSVANIEHDKLLLLKEYDTLAKNFWFNHFLSRYFILYFSSSFSFIYAHFTALWLNVHII